MSALILIVVILVIVAIVLWGLKRITFLDATIKQFLYYAIIVVTLIWAVWTLYTTFAR